MAHKYSKEELFEDYFHTLDEVMRSFEHMFLVDGIWSKIFGVADPERTYFPDEESKQRAKEHVRASGGWWRLEGLHDYAEDGVVYGENDQGLATAVMESTETLSFLTTELHSCSPRWRDIQQLADARLQLDAGDDILLEGVALLANVDIRTVRNAISAGELVAKKYESKTFVDNTSARNWLHGRRGFTPTKIDGASIAALSDISTPLEFGAFLSAQKVRLGLKTESKQFVAFHPAVDAKSLVELEGGLFRLPLDTVFQLADFYQVNRTEFLACVMRVFFPEQFAAIEAMLTSNQEAP